jgi:hypothetical protein
MVAIAYWTALRKQQDLPFLFVGSVQIVAVGGSMIACAAGLWGKWTGLMFLLVTLTSASLVALLYREEQTEAKNG